MYERRDTNEDIDAAIHHLFNLEGRFGWRKGLLDFSIVDVEPLTYDLLVLIARAGGYIELDRLYNENNAASSSVVIHHLLAEAQYYKFISINFGRADLLMEGARWMDGMRNKYRDAARRNQTDDPFTDSSTPEGRRRSSNADLRRILESRKP